MTHSKRKSAYLTDKGLEKLIQAKNKLEIAENQGNHYTQGQLTLKTELSGDICDKIWQKEPVFLSFLEQFCQSLGMSLGKEDFKIKRYRGMLQTDEGLEKLNKAKTDAEFENNRGNRYTREQLSEITGLSVDTCDKVLDNEIPVDKSTLKQFFQAFGLKLEQSDYYKPNWPQLSEKIKNLGNLEEHEEHEEQDTEPELPEGQVPLNSAFYIERSPIEQDCYKAILQPGVLLRLKSPRRTGKTSLMSRILDYADKHNGTSVYLSLSLADRDFLKDLSSFLKWFCSWITLKLGFKNCVNEYWDDLFGSKTNCQAYFEQYLLEKLSQPLILGLDDVDYLFQSPELADDFFGLLRSWHEEAKNKEIWQKLRLVVAHSAEVYIPINVNHSPFNVGIPIKLTDFTVAHISTLAQQHQLNWTDKDSLNLVDLVGGNPYLIRLSLYQIAQGKVTLEIILKEPITSSQSIYANHLQRQLLNLQKQAPSLIQDLLKVVMSDQPIDLNLMEAFKLEGFGLVKIKNNQVMPSCRLYAQYFRQYFQENSP